MRKIKCSIGLKPTTVQRIDAVCARTAEPRSVFIERAVLGFLEDQEMTVKVFTDPTLLAGLSGLFANPDLLRGLARALGDEVSDEQLRLFTDRMNSLVKEDQRAKSKKVSRKKTKGRR